MNHPEFDDIRPYRDEEIPAAMQRIASSEFFPLLATYIFPEEELEAVRRKVASIKTIREFQEQVMAVVNEQVIARSITSFTWEGIERLDPSERYLSFRTTATSCSTPRCCSTCSSSTATRPRRSLSGPISCPRSWSSTSARRTRCSASSAAAT